MLKFSVAKAIDGSHTVFASDSTRPDRVLIQSLEGLALDDLRRLRSTVTMFIHEATTPPRRVKT